MKIVEKYFIVADEIESLEEEFKIIKSKTL